MTLEICPLLQQSLVASAIPQNIYFMTYEPWNEDSFLIRFEHILEKNEDPELSKPVSFNLTHVFPGEFVFSEVTLDGNQWIGDKSRLHFKHEGSDKVEDSKAPTGRAFLTNLEITMKPMEIRTFVMSPPSEGNHGNSLQKVSNLLVVLMIGCMVKNLL
jgi:lysosomal alpha-mannosidase